MNNLDFSRFYTRQELAQDDMLFGQFVASVALLLQLVEPTSEQAALRLAEIVKDIRPNTGDSHD